MEKISINAVGVDESSTCEIIPAELPAPVRGQCCVVYNGRLLVIGGYVCREFSGRISEVSLVSPHTCKVLTTMPQRRWLHCVLLFGDKLVIFGGKDRFQGAATHASVLMYDIARNKFAELAPLPYSVANMAAVKWGDDNVIITGGIDRNEKSLNKVLIYNIKTQKIHMLPEMKYNRKGCVAAVVRDTVIVIGGRDETGNYMKSVESFRFDRFTWEELPEMDEARFGATAVVC
jgi:N-acetylneuraminic acid mutarotase